MGVIERNWCDYCHRAIEPGREFLVPIPDGDVPGVFCDRHCAEVTGIAVPEPVTVEDLAEMATRATVAGTDNDHSQLLVGLMLSCLAGAVQAGSVKTLALAWLPALRKRRERIVADGILPGDIADAIGQYERLALEMGGGS